VALQRDERVDGSECVDVHECVHVHFKRKVCVAVHQVYHTAVTGSTHRAGAGETAMGDD